MKYIPYYIIIIEHYDYFGGHKFREMRFNTLTEAWDYFKSHLKCVYYYDDGSFWTIKKPILRWEWEKPKHIYHNIRWAKKAANPISENVLDDEDIFDLL